MSEWFIPATEDFRSQRALLHLGLNKALRKYRELVVPGIGGVWFVRQLSWAASSIYLKENERGIKHKPAKIANAIEALAEKLEWNKDKENFKGKGKRAFARDESDNIWSFKELSDKRHYVQVTYRQSTVHAMSGLELAEGTRYNSMELTPKGEEFVNAFLDQDKGRDGSKIKNALAKWISGDDIGNVNGVVVKGLGKSSASPDEKGRCILLLNSDKNRSNLINTFSKTNHFPGIEKIKNKLNGQESVQDQLKNIDTAQLFDGILEPARTAIYNYAELLNGKSNSSVSEFVKDKNLSSVLEQLKDCADKYLASSGKKYPEVEDFAKILSSQSSSDVAGKMKYLVERDGNILSLSNDKIVKGHLFEHRKEIEDEIESTNEQMGSEELSTEFKLRQLFNLWRDCQ